MANPSTVENMLSAVPDGTIRRVLVSAFRYFLIDIRFGRVGGSTQNATSTASKATNLSGWFLPPVTTPSSANTEFAVPHNLNTTPYLCMQVLPLNVLNAGMVRLVVSRVADSSNLYLKSPDTSQLIYLYVEG